MAFDANSVRSLQKANVTLSMSLGNLWLEQLNRMRAQALKAADERAASTQQTVQTLAGARDWATFVPLQASLLQDQMTWFNNFCLGCLAETQSLQKAAFSDFRDAVKTWQDNCLDAMAYTGECPPMADAFKQMTAMVQQSFELAKANFDLVSTPRNGPSAAHKEKKSN
ncbi:hypothetical protein PTE30175_00144 [Pandoraea terrae]|uniref:Phasin domain-containing protein n=1 Tax=Pandoraea terrae TaxID=1537710 RepID=A0A5E4RET9_9BURK|nr:phasin family protein [Pandoraea terrae]VVD61926.1 hypothetical protein PTE30175_00144 [Pandoraea terrae]